MIVIRADAMGFCFGVRDALAVTQQIPNTESVTIHGELVHNETILGELTARGFQMTAEENRETLPQTPAVLITAHGVSETERRRLASAGKRMIDTTCPLVRRVHQAARSLEREGFHVLVIGRRGHVEVRGIIGDLSDYDVVETVAEVRRYTHRRLGIVCQSTTPPRLAEAVHAAVCEQNPDAEVRLIDTVCQPTRDRQSAAERLARQVDAVVVVGGRNSNNTRELAALCRSHGVPTFHVQTADDLKPDWFQACWVVGLTAGTSTPDETINDVEQALAHIAEGVCG